MKLFKYITIAFSSLFMCGCSDYLDNAPDDTLTMEMVFNDRTRTEDWLSGVYNRIPDNYWDLLKVWGYDSMGDDLDPSQRWYQWWGNSLNFIIGQWFTSSTWDAAIWSANPIRIRSAYLFIENAHALPDQGVSEANVSVSAMLPLFFKQEYLALSSKKDESRNSFSPYSRSLQGTFA